MVVLIIMIDNLHAGIYSNWGILCLLQQLSNNCIRGGAVVQR